MAQNNPPPILLSVLIEAINDELCKACLNAGHITTTLLEVKVPASAVSGNPPATAEQPPSPQPPSPQPPSPQPPAGQELLFFLLYLIQQADPQPASMLGLTLPAGIHQPLLTLLDQLDEFTDHFLIQDLSGWMPNFSIAPLTVDIDQQVEQLINGQALLLQVAGVNRQSAFIGLQLIAGNAYIFIGKTHRFRVPVATVAVFLGIIRDLLIKAKQQTGRMIIDINIYLITDKS